MYKETIARSVIGFSLMFTAAYLGSIDMVAIGAAVGSIGILCLFDKTFIV